MSGELSRHACQAMVTKKKKSDCSKHFAEFEIMSLVMFELSWRVAMSAAIYTRAWHMISINPVHDFWFLAWHKPTRQETITLDYIMHPGCRLAKSTNFPLPLFFFFFLFLFFFLGQLGYRREESRLPVVPRFYMLE